MMIKQTKNRAELIVSITGRLDMTTVAELEKTVTMISSDVKRVVFDFRNLNYISLAGLRCLLVCKKKISDTSVINVNRSVAEIFKTTGFSQLLPVSSVLSFAADISEVQELHRDTQEAPMPAPTAGTNEMQKFYKNISFKNFLLQKTWRKPNKKVIFSGDDAYTWADINFYSELIAIKLRERGVKKFSHVALCGANSPFWIFTFFALQKVGAIAIFINSLLKKEEIEGLAQIADVTHYCIGDTTEKIGQRIHMNIDIAFDFSWEHVTSSKFKREAESLRKKIGKKTDNGQTNFLEIVEPDDPALMFFSSGTTSKTKLVQHSAYNIFTDVLDILRSFHYSENDRACLVLPLFHAFGFNFTFIASMICDAEVHIAENVHSETVLSLVQKRKCTILHSVPTLLSAMAAKDSFSSYDMSSLHCTILAGMAITPSHIEFLRKKFPKNHFCISYGLSEILLITCTGYNDTEEHLINSVGRIVDSVEIIISDLKTGRACKTGEIGEILAKSPKAFASYYKLPIEEQPFDKNGFWHTGDLGYLSEDGYLYFTGRCKELIIRGGENIIPNEIEKVIAEHSSVESVKIVGVPNDFWGEQVCACIILSEDAQFDEKSLKEFTSSRLAKFKVPEFWIVFDKFPLLANGKIDILSLKKEVSKRRPVNSEA